MTRITDSQLTRVLISDMASAKADVGKYSDQLSTGIKVTQPGDSQFAGSIDQYSESLRRVDGHVNRIGMVQGLLSFQDDVLAQTQDILTRAKEIAAQGANESNSAQSRQAAAAELWQLRDQLVSLGNSQYQGKYIYGGNNDSTPPFSAATYTTPATGEDSQRYVFNNSTGSSTTRSVNITDSLSITVTSSGGSIFSNAISALERVGRALDGYKTTPAGSGSPDGGGAAYNLPTEKAQQTNDIAAGLDLIGTSVNSQISPERASVAGRLKRLDTATAILNAAKKDGQGVLGRLQTADVAEAATSLSQAQSALQAAYSVTSKVLNLSILNYL